MVWRLIISYIFNLIDLFCTRFWVNKFGLDIEANPVGRWFLENNVRQVIFKVVLPAALLGVLYIFKDYTVAKAGSWIIFILYGLLVIYHLVLRLIIR